MRATWCSWHCCVFIFIFYWGLTAQLIRWHCCFYLLIIIYRFIIGLVGHIARLHIHPIVGDMLPHVYLVCLYLEMGECIYVGHIVGIFFGWNLL